jgi:hypothetical protein
MLSGKASTLQLILTVWTQVFTIGSQVKLLQFLATFFAVTPVIFFHHKKQVGSQYSSFFLKS